uniref:Uncharacterized protein n=1 Tax=Solanum tuberosum TaxID=4113 RepID=M1DW77_SOLTU
MTQLAMLVRLADSFGESPNFSSSRLSLALGFKWLNRNWRARWSCPFTFVVYGWVHGWGKGPPSVNPSLDVNLGENNLRQGCTERLTNTKGVTLHLLPLVFRFGFSTFEDLGMAPRRAYVRINVANIVEPKEMNISRLMTHSQKIEEEIIKERTRDSKRERTSDGDFPHSRSGGHGRPQF